MAVEGAFATCAPGNVSPARLDYVRAHHVRGRIALSDMPPTLPSEQRYRWIETENDFANRKSLFFNIA